MVFTQAGFSKMPFLPVVSARYYLGKAYRSAKLGVATVLTVVSGGALFAGWLTSAGAFYIVLGTSGLAGSAFLFYDASKAQADIAKAMYKSERLAAELHQHADALQQENRQLTRNVDETNAALQKAVQHASKLDALQKRASKAVRTLEKELEREHRQVDRLTGAVDELEQAKRDMSAERARLSDALREAREHAEQLESLYQRESLNSQAQKTQIDKLRLIVESTQQVLLAVANQGDQFEQFGQVIDQHVIKLDQQSQSFERTAQVMDALLNTLQRQTFDRLDQNQDGVVSKEEFEQHVRQQKKE